MHLSLTLVDNSLKIWFSSPPEVGRGICIRLSRFDLVDSGSEEFKAICNQYPITLQGHLKEMRRKFKNRVST